MYIYDTSKSWTRRIYPVVSETAAAAVPGVARISSWSIGSLPTDVGRPEKQTLELPEQLLWYWKAFTRHRVTREDSTK